jgi:hypothetical protein
MKALGIGTELPKPVRKLAATHQRHHHVRQQQMDRAGAARRTKGHGNPPIAFECVGQVQTRADWELP